MYIWKTTKYSRYGSKNVINLVLVTFYAKKTKFGSNYVISPIFFIDDGCHSSESSRTSFGKADLVSTSSVLDFVNFVGQKNVIIYYEELTTIDKIKNKNPFLFFLWQNEGLKQKTKKHRCSP